MLELRSSPDSRVATLSFHSHSDWSFLDDRTIRAAGTEFTSAQTGALTAVTEAIWQNDR